MFKDKYLYENDFTLASTWLAFIFFIGVSEYLMGMFIGFDGTVLNMSINFRPVSIRIQIKLFSCGYFQKKNLQTDFELEFLSQILWHSCILRYHVVIFRLVIFLLLLGKKSSYLYFFALC